MINFGKHKNLFINEFEEHLQLLNDNLIKLEKSSSDKKIIDELMRSSHTIKSLCATMQFTTTSELAHKMEDCFDKLKRTSESVSSEQVNLLFEMVDKLAESKKSIKQFEKELDLKKYTDVFVKSFSSLKSGEKPSLTGSKQESISENQVESSESIAYIKVPVDRLDMLLNLIEELFIERIKFDSIKQKLPEEKETIDNVGRLISDIQYYILQTRLVPIDQVISGFPRMVRDLALKLNKKVDFVIENGGIELDRTIIDRLSEPLVHLLRNAVDHGISKTGKVTLTAKKEKDFVEISVENDDLPVDFKKVKDKALEKKLISQQKYETIKDEEVLNLLFDSKLSTKSQVTEVSGRGVGLGVVKTFVSEAGGRCSIKSPLETGKGVRVSMFLPVSVSIVKSLIVDIAGFTYAIPFSDIKRSLKYDKGEVKSVADQEILVFEKSEIQLVEMSKVFNLELRQVYDKPKNKEIVVIENDDVKKGIIIDEVIAEKEIVIKSFPKSLKGVEIFSGVTILDKGKVALVLNCSGIIKSLSTYGRHRSK